MKSCSESVIRPKVSSRLNASNEELESSRMVSSNFTYSQQDSSGTQYLRYSMTLLVENFKQGDRVEENTEDSGGARGKGGGRCCPSFFDPSKLRDKELKALV